MPFQQVTSNPWPSQFTSDVLKQVEWSQFDHFSKLFLYPVQVGKLSSNKGSQGTYFASPAPEIIRLVNKTHMTKILANRTISGKDNGHRAIHNFKHWLVKIVFIFQRHCNQDCAIPSKFLCLPNPRDREPPAEERDRSVQLSKELHKPRSTTIDQQRLCKTKDLIWTGQQIDNVVD